MPTGHRILWHAAGTPLSMQAVVLAHEGAWTRVAPLAAGRP